MRSVKGRRNADGSRCRSISMYSYVLFLGVSSPLKFCYRSPLVDDVPRARLARTREAAQRRPSVFDEVKRKDLTVFYLFLHITCRCRRPPPVHTQGHTLERVYASPPSAVRRVSVHRPRIHPHPQRHHHIVIVLVLVPFRFSSPIFTSAPAPPSCCVQSRSWDLPVSM
ncbi:hypothetical protein BKA93DRAFT_435178 [Sparassis latifolia]